MSQDKSGSLFEYIIKHKNLKNDAALSHYLGVAPPVISKIRHGRMPVGATLIIRIHEITDIAIRDIKAMIAEVDSEDAEAIA